MHSLFQKRRKVKRIQSHGRQASSSCSRISADNDYSVAIAFIASLKVCTKNKDLLTGSRIHTDIVISRLLEKNVYVGNTLVNMYAKCGALEKAQEVFGDLPIKTEVSWNTLISGYAENGHFEEALRCFEQMQLAGFSPDALTFACVLKACGSIGALDKGKEIHGHISKLEKDVIIANALIDMYIKCGALEKAQEVFDRFPVPNIISWTSLINGYAQHGHGEEAVNYFEQMHSRGCCGNGITFACTLKACGSIGALDKGSQIHCQVLVEGLLERDIVVANALVDMYAKCGALEKAQEVFDELPAQSIVSWTALISGYDQHGRGEEALRCCEKMQLRGFHPDGVAFACILRACGSIGALDKGQEIHTQLAEEHSVERHTLIANALVDMYAKCGALQKAQEVFDRLQYRDLVSWNALITGYAQHGCGEKALDCLERMQLGGFSPDAVTFVGILKACGSIGDAGKGQEIHAQIVRERLLEKHIEVGNALVDMYAKCDALEKAQDVFDELPARNLITWTGLIAGYAQHGHGEEALTCFEQMQSKGFCLDAVISACILKACGSIGAAHRGQKVHSDIVRHGWSEKDAVVGVSLLAMYAGCGMLLEAEEVFDKLLVRNVVAWAALMGGFARLEKDEVVLELFDKMLGEGLQPDLVTFTIVLGSCSRRGLVDRSLMYFEIISKGCRITPTVEHYNSMVDLFDYVGHLDHAAALIKEIPHSGNVALWHTLLGACRKGLNVKHGRQASDNATG